MANANRLRVTGIYNLLRSLLILFSFSVASVFAAGTMVAKDEQSNKVNSQISQMAAEIQTQKTSAPANAAVNMSSNSNSLLRVNASGQIQAYLHADNMSQALQNALASLDVKIDLMDDSMKVIQAWIPSDRVEQVSNIPGINKVDLPDYGRTRTGSVNTQGDAILGAAALRANTGLTGAGVRIAVISNGLGGLGVSQGTGDLPAITDVSAVAGGSGSEGTAMLEIIHDIAPNAVLGFCSGLSSVEFNACVNNLQSSFNADIIVDDLGFFLDPYFEDGTMAQTVAAAIANNVVYVSAAGNESQEHYQRAYVNLVDNTPPVGIMGNNFHDFGVANGGGSDIDLDLNIANGETLTFVMQWNEQFGQATSDYDFFITDAVDTVITGSNVTQDGDDDPLEFFAYTNNTGNTQLLKLRIQQFSGVARELEMFIFSDTFNTIAFVDNYNTPAGSVFGHPAVVDALAVGAIDAADPGNDTIEAFSSLGPSEIFFPAVEVRQKPDITGIDGVSVTGAGNFPSVFFGTSAAAPHVAAIAGLLKSGVPNATGAQIRSAILSSAIDLGANGVDNTFGAGRISAEPALQALQATAGGGPIAHSILPPGRSVQVGQAATAFASLANGSVSTAATGCTVAPITSVPGTFVYQTTDPMTNMLNGTPNTAFDIPAGQVQSLFFAFNPVTGAIPPTDVELNFSCANTGQSTNFTGFNTFLLSSSATPIPDIIALTSGFVDVQGTVGVTGLFGVASSNVGAADANMTVTVDAGALPINVSMCETDNLGACIDVNSIASTINLNYPAASVASFAVFFTPSASIPFDTINNRIFIRFRDAGGVIRGITSVSIQAP